MVNLKDLNFNVSKESQIILESYNAIIELFFTWCDCSTSYSWGHIWVGADDPQGEIHN